MRSLKNICIASVVKNGRSKSLIKLQEDFNIDLDLEEIFESTLYEDVDLDKFTVRFHLDKQVYLKRDKDHPAYPSVKFLNNISFREARAIINGDISLFVGTKESKAFIMETSSLPAIFALIKKVVIKEHSSHINVLNAVHLYILACKAESPCKDFIGNCILERCDVFSMSPGGAYLVALYDSGNISCNHKVVDLYRGRKFLW